MEPWQCLLLEHWHGMPVVNMRSLAVALRSKQGNLSHPLIECQGAHCAGAWL
jgi:hypothetical protein